MEDRKISVAERGQKPNSGIHKDERSTSLSRLSSSSLQTIISPTGAFGLSSYH